MQTNRRQHGRRRAGFTLIELLLVLMILVVLGSLAVGAFTGTREKALRDAASAQVNLFKNSVQRYELDMRGFPKDLSDLVTRPSGESETNWAGPYLESRNLPKDPWGGEYRFAYPGKRNPDGYDIWSVGPDGQDGTDDDIGNWEKG